MAITEEEDKHLTSIFNQFHLSKEYVSPHQRKIDNQHLLDRFKVTYDQYEDLDGKTIW